MQELLDLRQPALIALGHQRAIEPREGAVLARQQGGEPGSVAAAPGAEHRLHLAGGLLQLTQRLVEQPQLILARQRLQTAELFGQSLQARGRLAVGLRALHELRLDALLRIEPQMQVLEVGELDPHDPGRLAVEKLHREAEIGRRGTDTRVARLPEHATQRTAGRQRAMLRHPAGHLQRIELAQIELHHELARVRVGAVERRRQHCVLRRQQVHGTCQVYGVVCAADCPHRAGGVSGQAAEQAEREEPPACRSTHTTSVSSEPSACSSSVR